MEDAGMDIQRVPFTHLLDRTRKVILQKPAPDRIDRFRSKTGPVF